MKGYGVAGLALALLLGGVRADEKEGDKAEAVKEEWKRLNGTWGVVRLVVDDKEVPVPKGKVTLTLKDGKFTDRVGDKVLGEGTAEIDPTTSPKSLDIRATSGPNKGKSSLAIYEVKGDTLRVCWAAPGKPRPKKLESKEGSGHDLFTYKRAKPRN
jgi:uncharacterized protein (TIGR03067 family)